MARTVAGGAALAAALAACGGGAEGTAAGRVDRAGGGPGTADARIARAVADSAFADSVLRAAEDMGATVVARPSALPAPVRDPQEVRLALLTYAPGSYADELFAQRDSVNYRWPDRTRDPLRVWIQSAPPAGAEGGIARAVRDAFAPWTATGIPVAFAFTEDSARAEIHVTWVDRYESRTTGRTRWVHDQHGWITGASIELARAQPDGTPLDARSVHAIALHEVGHLLGLDHARDESHVMAPRVRVEELSEADRATVRLVYKLPPGRVVLR